MADTDKKILALYNKRFEELLVMVRTFNPNPNEGLIRDAWEFIKIAHKDEMRLSGEPVIAHLLGVAAVIALWKLDSVSIAAGLLHDTIEDAGVTKETLVKRFGEDLGDLVDGVTKLGKLKLRGSLDEEFVENLRKMLLVMSRDLRVVFLKLADRYENLQTLWALPKEKQERIARETLEIYAPLAERLGVGEMKGKLEDLAFPYAHPAEYQEFKEKVPSHFKKTQGEIEKMKRGLLGALAKEGIRAQIHGRAKHLYSLWQKLQRPEIDGDIEKVYDLVALRIIVEEIPQCYTALGVVHKLYRPVPHIGVSDFIAQPKPNGYRSIHTKVFGPGGKIVEVQIRTREMHEEAENGLAAHWYFSLIKSGKIADQEVERGFFAPDEKLKWVRQLIEWQKAQTDSQEFLRAVRFDALSHRNFVFSPKGDVFDLPSGATPIDFAYAVHTQIGDRAVGAKVDGKLVSLDYPLRSGQVVEIITAKDKKGPNLDWLNFVVTQTAKREIQKHLRKNHHKDYNQR